MVTNRREKSDFKFSTALFDFYYIMIIIVKNIAIN